MMGKGKRRNRKGDGEEEKKTHIPRCARDDNREGGELQNPCENYGKRPSAANAALQGKRLGHG
jgi:hypothetical protein